MHVILAATTLVGNRPTSARSSASHCSRSLVLQNENYSAGMIRNHKKATIIVISVVVALCAFAVLVLSMASKPFTKAGSVDRLQHILNATVEIKGFRQTYFPYAGYVAEGVTVHQKQTPGTSVQPFVSVNRLTVQASYLGLFHKPHRLSTVVAEGVHIVIPDKGINLLSQSSGKTDPVIIAELRIEQAILDVASSSHEPGPLRFGIHSARFLNVGPDATVAFSSSVHIPEPPGEVETKGWIGPWREDHSGIRNTPISGSYVLHAANLGHYASLDGILSSQGEFVGSLARLNVKGSTDLPDFGVRESGHHFHIKTRFTGSVDLKNGDVDITALQTDLGKTTLAATARVAGIPKAVSLNVMRGKGEVQDLILLFSNAPHSPILGPISFTAKAALPPGDRPFTERVRLEGTFDIDRAHFTAPKTQQGVDKLSAESQGEHSALAEDNDAVSDLDGQVALKDGIARFSQVTFAVPGATANMAGTYSLLDKRVKFDGKMRMKATLSQATTGAKSVFLKVLDPFYKKKGAGAELPVQMDGIYGDTHFSVGLRAKK